MCAHRLRVVAFAHSLTKWKDLDIEFRDKQMTKYDVILAYLFI